MNISNANTLEKFKKYVGGLDLNMIGPVVISGNLLEGMLNDLTAICRRCFRKKDVIVYVDTDEDEEMECGIVFTANGIVSWRLNGNEIIQIPYTEIDSVDYDEDEVIINHSGVSTELYLGMESREEKYSRYMYNFIMDILEFDENDVVDEENRNDTSHPLCIEIPGFLFPSQEPMNVDLSKYSKNKAIDVLKDILARYNEDLS